MSESPRTPSGLRFRYGWPSIVTVSAIADPPCSMSPSVPQGLEAGSGANAPDCRSVTCRDGGMALGGCIPLHLFSPHCRGVASASSMRRPLTMCREAPFASGPGSRPRPSWMPATPRARRPDGSRPPPWRRTRPGRCGPAPRTGHASPIDGLLHRLHLKDPVARDGLFRRGERPIDDGALPLGEPDAPSLAARVKPCQVEEHPGLLELVVEPAHLGQELLAGSRARFRVPLAIINIIRMACLLALRAEPRTFGPSANPWGLAADFRWPVRREVCPPRR